MTRDSEAWVGVAEELILNIKRAAIRGRSSAFRGAGDSIATFDHIENLVDQALDSLNRAIGQ